ncbi:hypothetical protein [Halorhabdus rudnickae]|uniref:hypothetical protein n=1 Tax=Halorhabdus rudnickae TaxID=1775544 RepID=UPI001082F7A5|nr:hypothetical protein [Halorhabdus rudnickae]
MSQTEHRSQWGKGAVKSTFDLADQPAKAIADAFDSREDLLEHYRHAVDFMDIDGVGKQTASAIRSWVEENRPEVARERKVNDEGVCTEFTTGHGLDLSDPDDGTFRFAFVCPRCASKNALKGDPDEFAGRTLDCQECRWVSLLDPEFIAEFREEHYDG